MLESRTETRMFCAAGADVLGGDACLGRAGTLGERLVNLARVAAALHMARLAEQRGSAGECAAEAAGR